MTNPPTFETLPPEIKLSVLHAVDDYQTLRALVLASPVYHAIYSTVRDEVLTAVTLSELEKRKIDVLTPVDFAEVCLRDGKKPEFILHTALQKIYHQQTFNLPIKLCANQCAALLKLVELKGFRRDRALLSKWNEGYRCVTHLDEAQYLNLYGWRSYHLLAFGRQTPTARAAIRRQINRAHYQSGFGKMHQARREAAHQRRLEGEQPFMYVEVTVLTWEDAHRLFCEKTGKPIIKRQINGKKRNESIMINEGIRKIAPYAHTKTGSSACVIM